MLLASRDKTGCIDGLPVRPRERIACGTSRSAPVTAAAPYRHEVDNAAVSVARQMLAQALAGAQADIRPGYVLSAVSSGASLIATVRSKVLGPLATVAVAPDIKSSAAIGDLAAPTGEPPEPSWCIAQRYPAYSVDDEASDWLPGFERVLAWAWLDGGRGDGSPLLPQNGRPGLQS